MTFTQYRRLVLVAVLPLLAAGWIFAKLVVPYGQGAYITCEDDSLFGENCRNVGWEGSLHDSVIADHPSWFTIQLPEQDKMPSEAYSHVTGSMRLIATNRIVEAKPFPLISEPGRVVMEGLTGKKALIQLGMTKEESSSVIDDIVSLKCNQLTFGTDSTIYEAHCYGDGWAGQVKFVAQGRTLDTLTNLRAEATKELDDARIDYRAYQIIMYPLFVYLFFIVSGLTWITRRTYRFVKG